MCVFHGFFPLCINFEGPAQSVQRELLKHRDYKVWTHFMYIYMYLLKRFQCYDSSAGVMFSIKIVQLVSSSVLRQLRWCHVQC